MNSQLFFAHVSSLSVLIPLTISFLQWKRLSFPLKIITWVLIFSALTDAICFIFISSRASINTNLIFNILCFIQFTLFVYAFSLLQKKKSLFVAVYIFFTVFYLVNLFWIDGPGGFEKSNVVSGLILIILCIHYLYSLLSELRELYIYRLPMLWIAFGVLAYCSGTLFLFLINTYLLEYFKESYAQFWSLNNLLNITQNILYAIGFWQNYRALRSENG